MVETGMPSRKYIREHGKKCVTDFRNFGSLFPHIAVARHVALHCHIFLVDCVTSTAY